MAGGRGGLFPSLSSLSPFPFALLAGAEQGVVQGCSHTFWHSKRRRSLSHPIARLSLLACSGDFVEIMYKLWGALGTDRLSDRPTVRPSDRPTVRPTDRPTDRPSDRPSVRPTADRPTVRPTVRPTDRPSDRPTARPSDRPTDRPNKQKSYKNLPPHNSR